MSTVMMQTRAGSHDTLDASAVLDEDLRDASAPASRRPGWYAVVVVLDALAIVGFITWVVIPRLS